MQGSILCVNAGSSSLKFALFDCANKLEVTLRGEIESLEATPRMTAKSRDGSILIDKPLLSGFDRALHALLEFTEAHLGADNLAAVGHRVVYGGADHAAPEIIDAALINSLEDLAPLDPLHMPNNLALMRAIAAARPELTQVACFDTAFHHTMPRVATRFALPRALSDAGVRRYGFHGLSYEFIAECLALRAPELAGGRVIVAHLGSGASLCALNAGKSIDTTTGFSALDGLVMATRCGLLDPGVILYLARQGHSFAYIEEMLYRRSGLLGVSGISGDIRVLLASDESEARDAIDLYTYRIPAEAGALASALAGLDGIVFTAGIGENSPAIRARVCARLGWLGVRVDKTANQAGADRISAPDSAIDVRVIKTDEEAIIARHTMAILSARVA
jgi:acetate kinase